MFLRIPSFAAIALLALWTPVDAAMIIDWGGNYIDPPPNSQPLQGKNSFFFQPVDSDGDLSVDDSIGGRLFSETTAMSPTSGYSGTSGTFYGGAITAHRGDTTTAQFDEFDIQNQGPHDELHVHLSSHGHFHDLHMVNYWDQSDYLGAIPPIAPVTFDATSSVTLDVGPGPVENLATASLRLFVRDDSGNFWLSQAAFTNLNSNTSYTWNSGNQGFSASDDGNWASFDPHAVFPGTGTAGSDLRFDQSSATFVTKDFTKISGLGYFFEQDIFHNNLDFHIDGFTANATVATIPEPGSLVLVAAVVTACVFRRRQLSKSKQAKVEHAH